jgi:hypothetical protein
MLGSRYHSICKNFTLSVRSDFQCDTGDQDLGCLEIGRCDVRPTQPGYTACSHDIFSRSAPGLLSPCTVEALLAFSYLVVPCCISFACMIVPVAEESSLLALS